MAFTTTIIECVRRQYAESWRKMVELRAQIQAQLKLAETLKKLAEHAGAGGGGKVHLFICKQTFI